MTTRFKNRIVSTGELLEVARRRVQDYHHTTIDKQSVDKLSNLLISTISNGLNTEQLISELPLQSIEHGHFIKDTKYFVGILNARFLQLQILIRSNNQEVDNLLSQLQSEVLALSAEVSEEELKFFNHYSTVHLNSFVRGIDAGLSSSDLRWLTDFKTSFTYPEYLFLNLIPGTGLTLPITENKVVPIIDAYILAGKSMVGTTIQPLIATSARNLFLPNEIFRYVFVRQTHDKTSRAFKTQTSSTTYPHNRVATVTIQLELSNGLPINYLKFSPLSDSAITISSISYVNESGEDVDISVQDVSGETEIRILFEPISARYITLVLEQYAPVTKSSFNTKDQNIDVINRTLTQLGFNYVLPNNSKIIAGDVYDFSLKALEVGLNKYETRGIFRSQDIYVNRLIGFDVRKSVEFITSPEIIDDYHTTESLPDGVVSQEAYCGVKLTDTEGNKVVESIVPIPDSYPFQYEYLAPVGDLCRVKLFPDLNWNIDSTQISNITAEINCIDFQDLAVTDYAVYPLGTTPPTKAVRRSTKVSIGKNTVLATYRSLIRSDASKLDKAYRNSRTSKIDNVDSFVSDFQHNRRRIATYTTLKGVANDDTAVVQYNSSVAQNDLLNLQPLHNSYLDYRRRVQELSSTLLDIAPTKTFIRSSGMYHLYAAYRSRRARRNILDFARVISTPRVGYSHNNSIGAIIPKITTAEAAETLYADPRSVVKDRRGVAGANKFTVLDPMSSFYSLTPVQLFGSSVSPRIDDSVDPDIPDDSVGQYCTNYYYFTTIEPHGFEIGDLVGIIANEESSLSGLYIVSIVADDYTFGILADAFPDDTDITLANNTIMIYNAFDQEDPVQVFENDDLLTIGVDYVISLDDGATWFGYYPTDGSFTHVYRHAKAGRFLVKLINRHLDVIYWIKYRVCKNQHLSQCNQINLHNGRVVVSRKVRDASGILNTILISRTNAFDPYVTSVVREYSLRAQEDVN